MVVPMDASHVPSAIADFSLSVRCLNPGLADSDVPVLVAPDGELPPDPAGGGAQAAEWQASSINFCTE